MGLQMGVFWLCCQLGMLTISRPETEIAKSIWNQDLKGYLFISPISRHFYPVALIKEYWIWSIQCRQSWGL